MFNEVTGGKYHFAGNLTFSNIFCTAAQWWNVTLSGNSIIEEIMFLRGGLRGNTSCCRIKQIEKRIGQYPILHIVFNQGT